jgi:hypothetical protein
MGKWLRHLTAFCLYAVTCKWENVTASRVTMVLNCYIFQQLVFVNVQLQTISQNFAHSRLWHTSCRVVCLFVVFDCEQKPIVLQLPATFPFANANSFTGQHVRLNCTFLLMVSYRSPSEINFHCSWEYSLCHKGTRTSLSALQETFPTMRCLSHWWLWDNAVWKLKQQ